MRHVQWKFFREILKFQNFPPPLNSSKTSRKKYDTYSTIIHEINKFMRQKNILLIFYVIVQFLYTLQDFIPLD